MFPDNSDNSKICDLELPNETEFSQSVFRNESPPSLKLSSTLIVDDTIDNQIESKKISEFKIDTGFESPFSESVFKENVDFGSPDSEIGKIPVTVELESPPSGKKIEFESPDKKFEFEEFQKSGFDSPEVSKLDYEIEQIEENEIPEPDVWNDLKSFDSSKMEAPVNIPEPEILVESKEEDFEDFDDFCEFVDHVKTKNFEPAKESEPQQIFESTSGFVEEMGGFEVDSRDISEESGGFDEEFRKFDGVFDRFDEDSRKIESSPEVPDDSGRFMEEAATIEDDLTKNKKVPLEILENSTTLKETPPKKADVPPIDDDFADFEAVIPSDRKMDNQFVEHTIESQSNEFAVDFASFESETKFQEPETTHEEQKPQVIEDDDDFDDFNDFKSADVVFQSHSDFSVAKPSNLNSTLEFMFPQTGEYESIEEHLESLGRKFLANLSDTDSMSALEYQYSSSKTSLSLIRSLGIDNRNVVSIFLSNS